ncbi:MAG: sigma-54-dependent Fis family transcriptional regulator [Anaerolineae bacterium]|nr:sigma-54-dependent Fis family transcriptional regulator [Gemmatimonadaceae bacterium]
MRQTEIPRILVVDDDRAFRLSTAALLRQDGYEAIPVASGQEAVEALSKGSFDLMLLDLRMPGATDGLTVIEALRRWGEGIPILMISGYGTIDAAVRALHLGADDFLTKPVEPVVLSARVAELLERRPTGMAEDISVGGMIGRSEPMRIVTDAILRVAPTEATVLVTGETGTGKELASRAVHDRSLRRNGPFVAVNCAALAEGLLESELFGHVRGSFTGALSDKRGLFEEASGGTLFLDEIGDVSLSLQQRLLRAIQEHEVRRVGAVRPTKVDVRVVAATSRDLRQEVAAGRFREDLFYRLNVFTIPLPPLRERRGDIPILIEAALGKIRSERPGQQRLTYSPLAMRMLRAHDWPGNVRELFAVINGAAIRTDGDRIEAQHLPPEVRAAIGIDMDDANMRYRADASTDDERALIVAALNDANGNRSRAAEQLGMGRTTLWRKMRSYGLEKPE